MLSISLRSLLVACALLGIILCLSMLPTRQELKASFHSAEELAMYHEAMLMSPVDSSLYFGTSYHCRGCHSTDPQNYAMVDAQGNDVAMYNDWSPTMMANAAKDPFWRAKVSHETAVNPEHKEAIENVCTSCHAPMGNYTARYHGQSPYTIADMLLDTVGLDGVSCSVCHQMSAENLGNQFSGMINFDTNRVQYGPYPLPFAGPMTDFVGFTPTYSPHINDAGICASCHTLITSTFDLNNEPTGGTYVEQATYHEWLNSQYNTDNISCQSCHMPRLADSVIISDNFNFLQPRFPYGVHELVGANTMMLKLMKENRLALDIGATEEDYDQTIAATLDMLQNRSIEMGMELEMPATEDTLYLVVKLLNKAGHKFPSGYPSRRAFVELLVVSADGIDTLFHSGKPTADYSILGLDPHYEPHYNVITASEQAQIYEVIPADVNGNFTTILDRAAFNLKDNRLPPLGFSTSHSTYDTTLIVGAALQDPDFNIENGEEGSGTDYIHYHIPRSAFHGGFVHIIARFHYQSIPPRWLEELFDTETPEIALFQEMYNEADKSPVLVSSARLDSVFLDFVMASEDMASNALDIYVFPNPSIDGWVHISPELEKPVLGIRVFDASGKFIVEHNEQAFQLPDTPGLYFLWIETDMGWTLKKVLR